MTLLRKVTLFTHKPVLITDSALITVLSPQEGYQFLPGLNQKRSKGADSTDPSYISSSKFLPVFGTSTGLDIMG